MQPFLTPFREINSLFIVFSLKQLREFYKADGRSQINAQSDLVQNLPDRNMQTGQNWKKDGKFSLCLDLVKHKSQPYYARPEERRFLMF